MTLGNLGNLFGLQCCVYRVDVCYGLSWKLNELQRDTQTCIHIFIGRMSGTEEVGQGDFGGCTVNDSFYFCYNYMFYSVRPTFD